MLILTRRIGETLMVGDEVTLTVLGVKGNQVRIGVNAPKDIPVHREEIYRRIQNEKNQGKSGAQPNHKHDHHGNHPHHDNHKGCCSHYHHEDEHTRCHNRGGCYNKYIDDHEV